jgi:hypothetical protein
MPAGHRCAAAGRTTAVRHRQDAESQPSGDQEVTYTAVSAMPMDAYAAEPENLEQLSKTPPPLFR